MDYSSLNMLFKQTDPKSGSTHIINRISKKKDYRQKKALDRLTEPKIHVSSLITSWSDKDGYCPLKHKYARLQYLNSGDIHQDLKGFPLGLSQHLTFGIGRLFESEVRQGILDTAYQGEILGKFSCGCGSLTYSGAFLDDTCYKCGEKATNYSEVPVQVGALSGRPDMIALVPNEKAQTKYCVLELKSINKASFSQLTESRISESYKLQVLFYLRMLRYLRDVLGHTEFNGIDFDSIDTDQGYIVYMLKDYVLKTESMLNVYSIRLDSVPKRYIDRIDAYITEFEQISDIKDYQGSGCCFHEGLFQEGTQKITQPKCPYVDICKNDKKGSVL